MTLYRVSDEEKNMRKLIVLPLTPHPVSGKFKKKYFLRPLKKMKIENRT